MHVIQKYFRTPLLRHYRNKIWNTLTDDTSILKPATASHFHIVVWTTQQYCFISPTGQTINMDWQAAFSKWRVGQSNSSWGMQVTAWNNAATIQMSTMKSRNLLQLSRKFNILSSCDNSTSVNYPYHRGRIQVVCKQQRHLDVSRSHHTQSHIFPLHTLQLFQH